MIGKAIHATLHANLVKCDDGIPVCKEKEMFIHVAHPSHVSNLVEGEVMKLGPGRIQLIVGAATIRISFGNSLTMRLVASIRR